MNRRNEKDPDAYETDQLIKIQNSPQPPSLS